MLYLFVCKVGRNQWAVVLSIDEGNAPLTSRRQSSIVIIVVSLWHSSSLLTSPNGRFSSTKLIGSQFQISAYLMWMNSLGLFFEDWNSTINLPSWVILLLSQTLSSLNTDGGRNETNEGNNQEASRGSNDVVKDEWVGSLFRSGAHIFLAGFVAHIEHGP